MTEAKPTVGEQLAVINTKLDVLIAGRDDHEARIRVLENSHQAGAGKAKVTSALIAALIALAPTVAWIIELTR